MNQYDILTEWRTVQRADEINLHLYKIPLQGEVQGEEKYSEGEKLAAHLKRLNNHNHGIAFHSGLIASFAEITQWDIIQPLQYEFRPILAGSLSERKLFEKLLKKELIHRTKGHYIYDKEAFRLKEPENIIENKILIFSAIHYSFTVDAEGRIFIGFERKYRFEYNYTIMDLLRRGKEIPAGFPVIDSNNSHISEYTFFKIASFTMGEPCPHLNGESILEYYQRKKQSWKIKGLSYSSLVVLVKDKKGKEFPYLPHLLKLTCSYDTITSKFINKVNAIVKTETNQRLTTLIEEVQFMLNKYLPELGFNKENMEAKNLGYSRHLLQKPHLNFGNNIVSQSILKGLQKGGTIKTNSVLVSFSVDPIFTHDEKIKKKIKCFITHLIKQSREFGVQIDISSKPKELRGTLEEDLFALEDLSLHLKSIGSSFEGTVIVLCSSKTIENAYSKIKKEFGGKQDLNTQFIVFDELEFRDSTQTFDLYTLTNILLGIYAKSGVQPWTLSKNLHSDCFIGLDVSHENKQHSTGVIQIVGNDGRLIKQKALTSRESGEKISNGTLEEIIYDSIHSHERTYGRKPAHITFHRDGLCNEDLAFIQQRLERLGISFDYVEILKNTNRRMATQVGEKWVTIQGKCYIKEREAFICSTNPKGKMGTARPIKLVQKTNSLPFESIVSDIYNLSFMHIHCMQKTRLPITTHYADLSSTFRNRGMLHPSSKHEECLPFV